MRMSLPVPLLLLLIAGCAPAPPAHRGALDLSNAPEPGTTAPAPSLGSIAHTGGGRLGGP